MVSIIMPARNAGPFLTACLDSILNQTYEDWELIVVDDKSSDDTWSIIEQYSLRDSRIKGLKNIGEGIIAALQTGYKVSNGQFITRMDADDFMAPNKLQLMTTALSCKEEAVVATGKVSYFSNEPLGPGFKKYEDWLNTQIDHNKQFSEIYKECVVPSPCWMIGRPAFEDCGGFESETYPEDYDLCFRFYQKGYTIVGIDTILHYWRDHPGRASRTSEHYAENSFLQLKTNYFIKIDYNPKQPLLLWGAGKKGKKLAEIFQNAGIIYIWACNNPSKIGHVIHGQTMNSIDEILENQTEITQAIIAVANPQDQDEIKNLLNDNTLLKPYWFC